jgi:putative glycerol-1-phosphate prenyltransferase
MLYDKIKHSKESGKKLLSVLVDPDRPDLSQLLTLVTTAREHSLDYFFVGGSLLSHDRMEQTIRIIKDHCDIPVIIFPGNTIQIYENADAILFLSLISGRNAEMLIGRQVIAAPYVKEAGLEVISTGYMLIDSGKPTSALYMSHSLPIPSDKSEIAACTAMAGEMLGLKMIYLEAGSGAENTVPPEMVKLVREHTSIPLITGGGVRDTLAARRLCDAGTDMIVVGTAVESNCHLLAALCDTLHSY